MWVIFFVRLFGKLILDGVRWCGRVVVAEAEIFSWDSQRFRVVDNFLEILKFVDLELKVQHLGSD